MKLNRINPASLTATKLSKALGRINDGGGLALLPNYKSDVIRDADGNVVSVTSYSGQHRWIFRGTLGGKAFEMGFGTLAEVTLADARARAVEARQMVGREEDPRKEKQDKRAADETAIEAARRVRLKLPVLDSLKDWALRYVDKQRASWAAPAETEAEWTRHMGKHVYPALGDRHIASITRLEITTLLNQIKAKAAADKAGKEGTATMHAVLKKLIKIFEFAVHAEFLTKNVCAGQKELIAKHNGDNNPAVETAEALQPILLGFENCGSGLIMKTAMQVQAYLFQRSDITTEMQWAHVNLPRALWTVPAADMKGDQKAKKGPAHEIALPRQVVILLTALKEITGGGKYVFPGATDDQKPMNATSLNNAMQAAMGKRRGAEWVAYQVAHGFRSLGITFGPKYVELYGLPLVKEVMDVISGHKKGDYLGQAYMRDDFGDRRPRYVQAYADWLDAVKAGNPDAMLTVTERKARAWEAAQAGVPAGLTAAEWAGIQAARAAAAAREAGAANDGAIRAA